MDNKNNPEKSSATKIGKYIPCRYSMSTIWAFSHRENKYIVWRRLYEEICMKKFC